MRLFILFLAVALTGFGCQAIGAGEKLSIETSLVADQTDWIKTHPKYKEVPKNTVNGITSWVEEEQTPNGPGYRLFVINADKSILVKGGGANTSSYIVPAPIASSTL